MAVTADFREQVRRMAIEAGAVAAGFARAGAVAEADASRFDAYLSAGGHFSMSYMERYREIRMTPLLLFTPPAEAGTVISMAFPYFHPGANPLFALYTQGEDYHKVLRRRLRPLARYISESSGGARCRICTDTAPILERYWAVTAGVGFIGRNHCLIVPGAGSFCFLAEIVTEAQFEPDAPSLLGCGDCGACKRGCPGGALEAQCGFDSGKCLSCLTIEHRGAWPDDAPGLPGPAIYGCDLCQQRCPHNAVPAPGLPEFAPSAAMRSLTTDSLAALDSSGYESLFASSAVTRCPAEQLHRNAEKLKNNNN